MTLDIRRPEKLAEKPLAVILDTDNTLYPYAPSHAKAMDACRAKAEKLLGIPGKDFEKAFSQARQEIKEQLGNTASSHSRLLYFQRSVELLGMKTQLLITLDLEQTYWRTFLVNSHLFEGVKDFMLNLRGKGIHTAIITDLTSQIQFRKIVYFGLDDLFDYVVTSEEVGADKPNNAPFKLAIDKLKVPPERIWMIGDHPVNDIEAAGAFGMVTLQKRHTGVQVLSGERAPDVVFDEFGELRQIFFPR